MQIPAIGRGRRNLRLWDEEKFRIIQRHFTAVACQMHDRKNIVQPFRIRFAVCAGCRGSYRHGTKLLAVHGNQVVAGILDRRSCLDFVLKQSDLNEQLPDCARQDFVSDLVHISTTKRRNKTVSGTVYRPPDGNGLRGLAVDFATSARNCGLDASSSSMRESSSPRSSD